MERTIRVTGKGNLSVKPDTVRLVMTMEGMKEEYDAALEESAHMTEYLKQMFSDLGFDREDIKTVRRHIVGGANRTLISVETPLRLCRIGTCRRLSAG